ncbi:hypothetical protein C8J56DRAFT_953432 [Mycena floridula]|nr:hypothetical protein C8J56DRAFT_953432 [Mycena floridula]
MSHRVRAFARGLRRTPAVAITSTEANNTSKILDIFHTTLDTFDTTLRELTSTKDRFTDISVRLFEAQNTAAESKEKIMLLTRRVNMRSTVELITSLYKAGPVGVQQVIDQIVRGHCNNFRPMGIPFQQALNQAIQMVIPAGSIEPRLLRQAADVLYHTLSKTYYGQHAATVQLKDDDFALAEIVILLALTLFYKAGYPTSQLVIEYHRENGTLITV